MTNARPSDPDPAQSPDVDSTGSAPPGVTPDSDSTSMQSDSTHSDSAHPGRATEKLSPTQEQSPTPQPGRTSPIVWIVVIAIIVLLLVVGLVGYAFEVF